MPVLVQIAQLLALVLFNRKTTKKTCFPKVKINKALKVTLINARSILSKLEDLQARVSLSKPDIIGITESWAQSNVIDQMLFLKKLSLAKKRQRR